MPGRARRETLSWDTGGIMGVPRRTSKSAGAQAAAKMPRVVARWHGWVEVKRLPQELRQFSWNSDGRWACIGRRLNCQRRFVCTIVDYLFVQIGSVREVEPCQDSMGDIFLLLSPWSKGRQDTSVCEFQCDESLSPRWGDHSGEMRVGACSCPH